MNKIIKFKNSKIEGEEFKNQCICSFYLFVDLETYIHNQIGIISFSRKYNFKISKARYLPQREN